MLVLAGLETGHKIGLAVVAALFIALALSASFLAPRRWPDFPGRNGLSVFVLGSLAMFVAMLAAVIFLAKESEEAGAEVVEGSPAHLTIDVTETDERLRLPPLRELKEGEYVFVVRNAGTKPHDLTIDGPNVAGDETTGAIAPGKTGRLEVSLAVGNYGLYSSVDGDREAGLVAQFAVG